MRSFLAASAAALSLASLLHLTQNLPRVASAPTFASGCASGLPAVMGPHLSFLTTTNALQQKGANGTLAAGATVFSMNGAKLEPDRLTYFHSGKDILFQVEVYQKAFRGLLIRVEAPDGVDTTNVIRTDDKLFQDASVCADETGNVVGLCHTDPSDKRQVNGTIRFDEMAENVKIDITIVFRNNNATSVFAYNSFVASFKPILSPSLSPTLSPTKAPTDTSSRTSSTNGAASTSGGGISSSLLFAAERNLLLTVVGLLAWLL